MHYTRDVAGLRREEGFISWSMHAWPFDLVTTEGDVSGVATLEDQLVEVP
jgi:hypothetical protein